MSNVLERQKEFLKIAISEARKKEYVRIKKIQNTASQSKRDALNARFENERQIDQNKIKQLSEELEVIKQKVSSGDLQKLNETRSEIPAHLRKMDKHKPNRFAGVEDYDDIVRRSVFIMKLV